MEDWDVEHDYSKQKIRLWILENVVKPEWSSVTFKYPCELRGYQFQLECKGVIHTGELMGFRRSLKEAKQFCVFYYYFNKESSRKVEIQVMETDQINERMLCYPGYVEDIRFLYKDVLFLFFFFQLPVIISDGVWFI